MSRAAVKTRDRIGGAAEAEVEDEDEAAEAER